MSWRTRAYATVLPALFLLAGLCWALTLGAGFDIGAAQSPGRAAGWLTGVNEAVRAWIPMIGAIMLPTVAPMAAGYISFTGKADNPRPVLLPAGLFIAGYFLVWAAAGGMFAALQTALDFRALTAGAEARLDAAEHRGALLIAIGLYQVSMPKQEALSRCRSPLAFFMSAWREGSSGALVMGLRHGAICLVSSAGLILLLFVTGTACFLWFLMVMGLVLIEKRLVYGQLLTGVAGLLMIVAGAGLIGATFV